MTAKVVIYLNSDTVFKHTVKDDAGALVTGATVSGTLKDAQGAAATEISGQSWPLSLAHAGSGVYRGTLQDTLVLTAGTTYYMHVTSSFGGAVNKAEVPCQAQIDDGL